MSLSEEELTKEWGDWDKEKPVVSVICCTYNQEIYIEDALKGFFSQKTNFPFEVIVQNDASTDSTKEIIERWHAKYPNVLKPFHHDENQFSQGNKPGPIAIGRSKGEYIAMCDGDDYWLSFNKLQSQHDSLRKTGAAMSFHSSNKINENGEFIGSKKPAFADGKVLLVDDILRRWHIDTATIFFKKSVYDLPLSLRNMIANNDWFFQLMAAHKGGVVFTSGPISVYRKVSGGVSSMYLSDLDTRAVNLIMMFLLFDQQTEGCYREAVFEAVENIAIDTRERKLMTKSKLLFALRFPIKAFKRVFGQ